MAARKKATPAQIALLWSLAQKPWIVPIPGTTQPARLAENPGAAALTLAAEDLKEIGAALEAVRIQGARYPEGLMKMVGL